MKIIEVRDAEGNLVGQLDYKETMIKYRLLLKSNDDSKLVRLLNYMASYVSYKVVESRGQNNPQED